MIHGYALLARDALLGRVVSPGREDEESALGDRIEERIKGLVVSSKAVVREIDDGVALMKKNVEHLLLVMADERRDHDGSLSGSEDTGVLVIAEGGAISVFDGLFDPHAADVNGHIAGLVEELDIAYTAIHAAGDLDVLLYIEIARLEAFGSEALWVHPNVTDHALELTSARKRTDERLFCEDRSPLMLLGPNAIRQNRRSF